MNFVTVLFFLGLLLTIVASVGLLRLTGKKAPQEQRLWPLAQKPAADEMAETEKDTENAEDAAPEQAAPKTPAAGKKRLSVPNLIVLAVSAVLVVLGLGDLFGIADYGQFEGAFLLMGIAAVLQYAACLLYQCRKSRTVRFFSKLLLVMTVLELTVFQYPSYHLMLGDYPEKILLPSDATVESGDYTLDENLHTLTITGKNECVITFNDLNVPIGTVRAVAKLGKDTKQSQMVLDMADATHVDYRYDIAKQALVKGRENTQYIACEFSGDVSKLRLKFTGKNDGDGVVVQHYAETPVSGDEKALPPYHYSDDRSGHGRGSADRYGKAARRRFRRTVQAGQRQPDHTGTGGRFRKRTNFPAERSGRCAAPGGEPL